MYKCAPLSMLRVGATLGSPIQDKQGKLLLGDGIEITKDLLVKLHKRGVQSVVIENKDWIRMTAFESKGKVCKALPNRPPVKSDAHSKATEELDKSVSEMSRCEVVASDQPYSAHIQSPGATRYEQKKMDQLFDHHQQTVSQVEDLLGQLSLGETVAAEALQKVSQETVRQAIKDIDLFVCMGINPVDDDLLYSHSTNVATLAIAVGATLGLDEQSLCDLGAGCLVNNAGMMKVDEKLYNSNQVLDPVTFLDIIKHSIISADLLFEKMKHVPVGVRMVVYQMHERCDGSGYPRGVTADRIHPLAKISGVADAYVALVSPRPHRHALLPYFAMKKMLEDVRAGLYDAAVIRALLHTVSLFPIGSYCELSDGRVAKVIRSNGPAYDRPVVEAWQRPNFSAEPDVVDLTEEDVKVVKPLTSRR